MLQDATVQSTTSVLREYQALVPIDGWSDIVKALALKAFADFRGVIDAERETETSRISDKGLELQIDHVWGEQLVEAVEFGALIGFALARTWPTGLEGFDDWFGEAQAFVLSAGGCPSLLHLQARR